MIKIYTDGSYSPSRKQGGWAYVILHENKEISSDYMGVLDTTNNRMELQACIEAIKRCKELNIYEFTIYSDSMYIIGTMTQNWRKKANIDLWMELSEAIDDDMSIEWKHVKGHSKNKWNDRVDMLAVHCSQININKNE